jgi:hypothetical protein
MPLPKISLPIYELTLPSNNKKVKYRPFTVKEEKILLTAQESKEFPQIMNAIKQIVNNCVINYDIDKLALFDLEYIILTLRSKSVDNLIKFKIKDPETEEEVELALDLSDIKIDKKESHTNKIQVSDEYYLFMRYPTIDEFMEIIDESNSKSETDKNYNIMISCMDTLSSETEVHKFSDFTDDEIQDFIDSLTTDVTRKIKDFFDTLPKIRFEIKYKNSLNQDKTFVIQGTQSFFL